MVEVLATAVVAGVVGFALVKLFETKEQCPHCRCQLPKNTVFCSRCGQAIRNVGPVPPQPGAAPAAPSTANFQPPKKVNHPAAVALMVLVAGATSAIALVVIIETIVAIFTNGFGRGY